MHSNLLRGHNQYVGGFLKVNGSFCWDTYIAWPARRTLLLTTIYQDAARTSTWGSGANALTGTGTGATVPLIVYGRVPMSGLTPAAGTY
nr:spore coat protein U domain-containing protein [Serratia sp. OS31]